MSHLNILTVDEIRAFDKPPKLTEKQRENYFHFHEKLIKLLNKLRNPIYKLCVTLHWGYFRASVRFFLVKDFHLTDVKYICNVLEIPYQPNYLLDYQQKRKTIHRHQKSVLNAMNFQPFGKEEEWFQAKIKHLTEKQMQPREMIYFIASQCHQKQIEITSYYYFAENITTHYNKNEKQLLAIVKDTITVEQQVALDELISTKTTPPLLSEWRYIN